MVTMAKKTKVARGRKAAKKPGVMSEAALKRKIQAKGKWESDWRSGCCRSATIVLNVGGEDKRICSACNSLQ